MAVRLDARSSLSKAEEARVLVAFVRHAKSSLSEILSGQQVLCALIVVPTAKFDPEKPCGVSWWRGGRAAIGDVKLAP
ncbi:hypothetical protein IHQ68_08940 [Chelatococcus sambhunathii]|uniref:Uncharacterized protein n=1 Tax=Chelatococcus sambhunathii TaxID=363953 RepID=A0ABU1DF34_9HYPH|nr:hypothetical protein [Chelatococcus sambhunathii]MDR4306743.1 hypothetical protein [Chelatococcus sambhunathii]